MLRTPVPGESCSSRRAALCAPTEGGSRGREALLGAQVSGAGGEGSRRTGQGSCLGWWARTRRVLAAGTAPSSRCRGLGAYVVRWGLQVSLPPRIPLCLPWKILSGATIWLSLRKNAVCCPAGDVSAGVFGKQRGLGRGEGGGPATLKDLSGPGQVPLRPGSPGSLGPGPLVTDTRLQL